MRGNPAFNESCIVVGTWGNVRTDKKLVRVKSKHECRRETNRLLSSGWQVAWSSALIEAMTH